MKKLLCLLVALLLVPAISAMGEGDEPLIKFNRNELYLRPEQSFELEIVSAPAGGVRWGGFTYESSDKEIAKVNKEGTVKGIKVGECTVTVTSKKDPSVVTVVPVHVVVAVTKLIITTPSKHLGVGEQRQLTVAYEPENASYKAATFASSDEKIATVDSSGVVTGVKKGSFTITVRSQDGKKSETIDMRVTQQPTGISVSMKNPNLIAGQTARVTATVTPENASNKNVTWSSSDTAVATVNKDGQVTGKGMGTAVITAACEDAPNVIASLEVRVVERVKKVAFTMSEPRIHVGDSMQLSWTAEPETATDKSVKFTSSKESIATVDQNGVVTGVKAGKATITMTTTDGGEKSAKIVVHIDQPASGVHLEQDEIRIAVGYRGTIKAVLEPEGATNTNMTWVSSDSSIATVSGTGNKVTIKGRKWGDCVVTGTTEDGGFSASITVHIGSYRFAIKVVSVKIANGKPRLVLKNVSNLNISQVRYQMRGYDAQFEPVEMTTRGNDLTILKGTYDLPLAPEETTKHGNFSFYHHSDYDGMLVLEFCITGITTEDGMSYEVPKSKYNWVQTASDPLLFRQED